MADNTGRSGCSWLVLCLLWVGCGSIPPAQTPAPPAPAAALAVQEPSTRDEALSPLTPIAIEVLDGVLFAAVTRPDGVWVYRFEGDAWVSVGDSIGLDSRMDVVPVLRTRSGDAQLVLTDEDGRPVHLRSLESGAGAEVSTPGRLVAADELVVAHTLIVAIPTDRVTYSTTVIVERWNGTAFEEILRQELSRQQPAELRRIFLRDDNSARAALVVEVCEEGVGCHVNVVSGSKRRRRTHDLGRLLPTGGLVASSPPALRVAFTTAPSENSPSRTLVRRLNKRRIVDEPALPLGVTTAQCPHVPLDLSGDPPLLVVSECMPDQTRRLRVLRLEGSAWVDAWNPRNISEGTLESARLLGNSVVVVMRADSGVRRLFRGSASSWETLSDPR